MCLLKSSYSVHTLVTYHTLQNALTWSNTPSFPQLGQIAKSIINAFHLPLKNIHNLKHLVTIPWASPYHGNLKNLAQIPYFSDCSEWTSSTHKFFCLIFSLKEKTVLTEKKNRMKKRNKMKDPYWQLLPRDSALRFNLCCRLRHWHFLSLCNTPEQEIWSTVILNNGGITSKNTLVLIISFHKNPKFSSFQQNQDSSSKSFKISCWVWCFRKLLTSR